MMQQLVVRIAFTATLLMLGATAYDDGFFEDDSRNIGDSQKGFSIPMMNSTDLPGTSLSGFYPYGIIVEPFGYGNYEIDNETDYELHISARDLTSEDVQLINDIVPKQSRVLIYTFVEGSGGHLFPTNAFSEFKIEIEKNSEMFVVYSGVENADWEEGRWEDNSQTLLLKITDEMVQ